MSSKTTIILLQQVSSLGNKWTLHDVSLSYFNNVLKPKWLAKLADATTINNHNQKKIHDQKEIQARMQALQWLFDQLKIDGGLTMSRQCTEMQHLYDKIDAKDICQDILLKHHIKIDKSMIKLGHTIDVIGEYTIGFVWEGLKLSFVLKVVKK